MIELIKKNDNLYEIKVYYDEDGVLLDKEEMKQLASLISN